MQSIKKCENVFSFPHGKTEQILENSEKASNEMVSHFERELVLLLRLAVELQDLTKVRSFTSPTAI